MDINSLFPASFLKAADLQGQPRTATIESCAPEQIGDSETKPVLRFVGIPKGLVLNRTNATVIASAFGTETDHWRGQQVTLFSMPVSFQGRMVDGIRVQAAAAATPEQAGQSFQAPPQPPAVTAPAATPQPAPAAPPAPAEDGDLTW